MRSRPSDPAWSEAPHRALAQADFVFFLPLKGYFTENLILPSSHANYTRYAKISQHKCQHFRQSRPTRRWKLSLHKCLAFLTQCGKKFLTKMKKSFDFKVRSAYLILEGITATAVIFDVVIISGKFLSNERAINDAIVLTGRDRLPGIVGG
ncbi:MAG TPA: hypothetical protein P5279_14245 [Anaerohalosphaeraceae bacterium]|jgi:hypothetical protein|nr:hypothetical protein [Anaerohalosphaeraceae bacterium]HRT51648.1 hypothetical protein [Anaerohalosphaeraceae bacterium]HRT87687.1 hypothetical protein [Anaerohalosphaeraceae bacterium]